MQLVSCTRLQHVKHSLPGVFPFLVIWLCFDLYTMEEAFAVAAAKLDLPILSIKSFPLSPHVFPELLGNDFGTLVCSPGRVQLWAFFSPT